MEAANRSEEYSPYAPIRLRGQLWWGVARKCASAGMVTAKGMISTDFDPFVSEIIEAQLAFAGEQQRSGAAGVAEHMAELCAKIISQRDWVLLAAQYEKNGRQIFDLHDHVVELLNMTDLGTTTLLDINLPYDCFFIRFGKQDGLSAPFDESSEEHVDGAFIAVSPYDYDGEKGQRLKIGLTMVKDDGHGVMLPGYFVDILPNERQLPVMDALTRSLTRMADRSGLSALLPPGKSVHDSDWDLPLLRGADAIAAARVMDFMEGIGLLKKAMPLIANCLFYLESLKSLPRLSVGRDVPPALEAEWLAKHESKRHKLQSNLFADGYAVVRFVGDELGTLAEQLRLSRGSGPRAAHWRRGHQREQWYGPKDAQTKKRIWIKPTLVNAAMVNDGDMPGHIYVGSGSQTH